MAIIGIDVTALSTSACGGIGTSQYRTLRALAELETPHRFVLYAAKQPFVPFTNMSLDLPWALRLGSGPCTRSNILWMQTGVNRLLAADRVEVFWGPRHLLPLRAPGLATVATVHDFWGRYHPGQQPWINRTATRLLTDRVMARASVVVAPSVSCARDAERFAHLAPGSVRVVPWGVDEVCFRPVPPARVADVLVRLNVRRPYVLSLDVFNPRKGFAAVLAATAQAERRLDRPLDVVGLGEGRRSAARASLSSDATRCGRRGRVRFPGDVTVQDLVALYSGADALVYASVYEGFGLPVLEAMACGCPVIAGDRASLPEVAGEAALLVDPSDPYRLADAVVRVVADPGERARLAAAGRGRAAAFTWRRTAEAMLDVFADAQRARPGADR
jgi:glycosyltransferase involved in cell wall biosynthesis